MQKRILNIVMVFTWFVFFLFPLWAILAVTYIGPWGILSLPLMFGWCLWAVEWMQLIEYTPKHIRTWRDHMVCVAGGVLGGPLLFAGFVAIMWVIGSMIEGSTNWSTHRDRCNIDMKNQIEYEYCIQRNRR